MSKATKGKRPSVRMVVEFQGSKDVVRRMARTLEALSLALIAARVAEAVKPLEDALKFYAKHEHWMGLTSDDYTPKLLVANGNTPNTEGWAVAEAALQGKAEGVG
jgi:pyruvate/2-oxoglutarate dehydrogenase complex dihydrolipoamide dehydrogenase (E3) component